ncbi:hypothetical protein H845_1299 [Komagataeibacter xylinus E25]|nr:hypothetical protein H845_1299 [Komagataeibacter xylinus E25]RFP07576.1 hypothetical protein BFX83_07180 [Komagataeibacter xylinus]
MFSRQVADKAWNVIAARPVPSPPGHEPGQDPGHGEPDEKEPLDPPGKRCPDPDEDEPIDPDKDGLVEPLEPDEEDERPVTD